MSNVIPRSDGVVIAPAQVFSTIQKNATMMAKDAFKLKNAPTVRGQLAYYQQCRRQVIDFNALKGNALLKTYANSIHPDVDYDIDVALDGCIAGYMGYANWFKTNVASLAKDRKDETGEIVPVEATTVGMPKVLNAILATVE